MIFKKYFYANTRKPKGFLGNIMINKMNAGHAKLSDWGLSHLKNIKPSEIADLGCGGGINVAKLIKLFPEANVTGLDYSSVSVKKSEEENRESINNGVCNIVRADVSAMPFESETFDLITAFETVYFWPGPLISFKEVYRTLKPGGTFMIVNEFDGIAEREAKYEKLIDGLKIFNKEQLTDLLKEAGFNKITVNHEEKKHWLCILAVK